MTYTFQPRGVCSRAMTGEVDDQGVIRDLQVVGGCNGNLKAISKLVAGQPVQQIVDLLAGNTCGPRPTSCADQMTLALKEAVAKANA